MNLAKIDEVIKASPAIQIQSRISLLQRRGVERVARKCLQRTSQ